MEREQPWNAKLKNMNSDKFQIFRMPAMSFIRGWGLLITFIKSSLDGNVPKLE